MEKISLSILESNVTIKSNCIPLRKAWEQSLVFDVETVAVKFTFIFDA
jgi:hypothetical protein